jgi:hypothetical protein
VLRDGRIPSATVPQDRLLSTALKVFWGVTEISHRDRVCRDVELDENDRISRGKRLAQVPLAFAIVVCLACFLLFTWIWHLLLLPFIPWSVSIIASGVLSLASCSALLAMVESLQLVEAGGRKAETLHSLLQTLHRQCSLLTGRKPLLTTKAALLETQCVAQLKVWRRRIAVRSFFAMLNRRRITLDEAIGLLTDLCEEDAEVEESDCADKDDAAGKGKGGFLSRIYRRARRGFGFRSRQGVRKVHKESRNSAHPNSTNPTPAVVRGTLPGSAEEAMEFLNLGLEKENSPLESNRSVPLLTDTIERVLEPLLKEMPIGTRVEVALSEVMEPPRPGWSVSEARANELYMSMLYFATHPDSERVGTVVWTEQEFCTVLIDGEPYPLVFHTQMLRKLPDERALITGGEWQGLVVRIHRYDPNTQEYVVDMRGRKQRIRESWVCPLHTASKRIERLGDAHEEARTTQKRTPKILAKKSISSDGADASASRPNPSHAARQPSESEDTTEEEVAPKASSIGAALKAGGWRFLRKKKHITYERSVLIDGAARKQHFTRSCTPSSSTTNSVAQLNRLNREGVAS